MGDQDPVRALLESSRESYYFSAYQVFAEKGQAREWLGGVTSYWPGAVAVTPDTLFDIGSVTKAVVATSLTALAVDRGKAALTDTVGKWVPEWRDTSVGSLSLHDLLCHASGLRAWLPLFLQRVVETPLREWVMEHSDEWIEASPGTRATYSDLGFIVLGEVLSGVWQKPLERAFIDEVAKPLALKDVTFAPIPAGRAVAATEVRGDAPISGVVFDENSVALGGKTPHAGLFSTARGLAPWCREWLLAVQGKSTWLNQETAKLFTTKASRIHNSSWALGWDTRSAAGSSSGKLFSPSSFGHLGYPGCSVWMDPQRGGFVIFFSNRVHPSRLDERIRSLRPVLHDTVTAAW